MASAATAPDSAGHACSEMENNVLDLPRNPWRRVPKPAVKLRPGRYRPAAIRCDDGPVKCAVALGHAEAS